VKNEGYFTPKNELMEVFINKWLHSVYKHEVQPTTFERAEYVVKNHILPAFAKMFHTCLRYSDMFISSSTGYAKEKYPATS
jgi:Phage integrase, N-terminal SAM-like domain